MINLHLVQQIDSPNIEEEPIRTGFGRGLVEAGKINDKVVALCADLTGSTKMNMFAEAFAERFFEVGIAEQNLATVAAGMARMGYVPFASSYAAFSPGRNWEQIKTTAALNDLPVKMIGSHAGISVGPDGATHQMLEDIAIMRVIPNMKVIAPGDSIEAEKATLAMAEDKTPNYMRLAREATPIFTTKDTPFQLNRAWVMMPGKDVTIIGTGTMSYQALLAGKMLRDKGIEAEVIHCPVIKPLDGMTILKSVEKTGCVVTAEEAQIMGGLGGAVAELLSEHHPVPLRRIGVRDRFGESGDPHELLEAFGLTAKDIAHKVEEVRKELH